jgi:tRNA threonylcarbamoyladenosine biosynthesis protein TsaB
MLVAALDTSTNTLSCAVVEIAPGRFEVREAVAERPAAHSGGHSPRLPGVLVEILARAGRVVADLDAFAVGLGPGSFTGLRIGLATWKGLAYARRRPVAGASGLRAMALEAAPLAPEGALLVPVLDARKSEVYAGFYRATGGGLEAAAHDAVLSPAALAARVARAGAGEEGGPRVGFGEGWEAYRPVLEDALPALPGAPATPSAAAVARCVAPHLLGAPFDLQALFALEPRYLRPSEAEVKFPDGLPATRR